ncbi:hypothetical protein G9A89_022052 [Geosiphon pyriformis]|nr:hypothetical protein G9A89_022052 [Geosiphon pyriformis]
MFADKGKERLQTPAGTPKQIQLPIWKKQRFNSPANLSYHHTPGSTINIISTDMSTTNTTTLLNKIPFQSKQKKTELLGTYSNYFERFKLAISSWKITDSEEEEAESAFNFYINKKIVYLLRISVNIESARETFYNKLIQNTSLLTNHNFASIIIEINKEIKHHTQQKYPITYTSKGKRKLQTPAVTSQRIQPPTWKKTRVESPNNSSYHYTPESAINISSTDTSASNATSIFGHFPFQSKQKKEDLLGLYDKYFEKITESEEGQEVEEKKESENHKFTYQNLILENPETKFRQLGKQHSEYSNTTKSEQSKPQIIVIDQPPVKTIGQPIQSQNQQQPPPILPQQQQQQLPLPQQQQMAYIPIIKLDKFNGEEDDAQYQSLTVKPQNFNRFKTEFLQYFSNNNSINKLANIFTMIRQGNTEAVTTYLRHFHRNLHQIQAIQVNYFTTSWILNQFIRGLRSSILQQVHPMHPVDLPAIVTYARDFEAAELEANHAQAVNLAMNRLFELDFKLKQFIPDSESSPESRPIPTHLPAYDAPTNLSTASLLNSSLSTTITSNLSDAATSNISTTATSNLSNIHHLNTTSKSSLNNIRESKIEDHPKLEIGDGCISTNSQLFPPTIRISSVEFGHQSHPKPEFPTLFKPFDMPLFSRAALEEKLIMTMYTNVKINGHFIKLILDSGCQVDYTASTRIITADGATKTPIGEIDDFPIKVNGITIPIKVLVIEATHQNGQYMRVPAMCGHFKPNNIRTTTLLIEFEKEENKPTWKSTLDDRNDKESGTINHVLHVELSYLMKECEMTFLGREEHVIRHRIAYVKAEDTTTSELLEIKNNPLSLPEPKYVQTSDCNFIYNLPSHMIYTIPEEKEPISSCASESESIFNPNSNSDNDDNKNTSSSSIQYGNNNDNNSNSDLNSDPDYEQYIALLDLAKEQELK